MNLAPSVCYGSASRSTPERLGQSDRAFLLSGRGLGSLDSFGLSCGFGGVLSILRSTSSSSLVGLCMFHLYIDEAGNTGPGASNRHTQRYLNLTGVIVEETDQPSLHWDYDILRGTHFGHSDTRPIVLHRSQLSSKKGIYERLADDENRLAWEIDCLDFLKNARITLISVTVDKIAFYYDHPSWIGEPYDLCAFNILERFHLFLHHRDAVGRVHVETRNPREDELFRQAFDRFLAEGNRYVSPQRAQHRLGSHPVTSWKKNDNVIGCQIADLACQPMLEASRKLYTGIVDSTDMNRKIANTLWPKLYRGKNGKLEGCGLVWRPKRKRLA